MTDHSARGAWDLIVTPWHLDEHIPAFPVPAGVAEASWPAFPAGPVPGRRWTPPARHAATVRLTTRAQGSISPRIADTYASTDSRQIAT